MGVLSRLPEDIGWSMWPTGEEGGGGGWEGEERRSGGTNEEVGAKAPESC